MVEIILTKNKILDFKGLFLLLLTDIVAVALPFQTHPGYFLNAQLYFTVRCEFINDTEKLILKVKPSG